MNLIETA